MTYAGLLRRATVYSVLLSGYPVLLPSTAAIHAQAPSFRSVTGTVVDKGGAKVKGAVVHLKDTRSLAQRTYITADDGTFRFSQLSAGSDYEIWADLDGKKTPSKTVSSFTTKASVDFTLKLPG